MIGNVIRGGLLLLVLMVSCSVFADRILISGKPVELIPHPGYYTFPVTQQGTKEYYFVKLNDVLRVCYLIKKPELAKLDRLILVLDVDGKKFPWQCYQYNSRVFEIDF